MKDIYVSRAIIETPKGSRNKYKYDGTTNFFELDKILPSGTGFPFDFGFIPGTKGEDGDPLDVIVFMDVPAFPGCSVKCRLIGVLEIEQKKKKEKKIRNDRFIGIENNSLLFAHVHSINDVNEKLLHEVIEFFRYYSEMEEKKFYLLRTGDSQAAKKLIKKNLEENNS